MKEMLAEQSINSAKTVVQSVRVPEDVTLWRISVDQYHAMIASGAFDEDAPIELLEGWLVEKMPKNPAHALATELVCALLRAMLSSGWFVRAQDPITLSGSEPEPDIAVVKGHPRQYSERHPNAVEVALIVEVADSSLGRDRSSKKRVYAQAGIPIYWIVNLTDRWIEVYENPASGVDVPDYQSSKIYHLHEQLPLVVDGVALGIVSVGDLLPN